MTYVCTHPNCPFDDGTPLFPDCGGCRVCGHQFTEEDNMNDVLQAGGENTRGPATLEPTGLAGKAASMANQRNLRLFNINERLNDLAARIIGPENLPRNTKDRADRIEKPSDPRPAPSAMQVLDIELSEQARLIDEIMQALEYLETL